MSNFEMIKAAVARVVDGVVGEPLGSAFYIGENFALSALHVVATTDNGHVAARTSRLKLQFPEVCYECVATMVAWDVAEDWVVLSCDSRPPMVPVECSTRVLRDDKWFSYGFPGINQGGQSLDGVVRDPDGRDAKDPSHRLRAIVLFSDEAASGQGASMHGFSGAPCVVDGRAVGILRSALMDTVMDGDGAPRNVTVAGTLFACQSSAIVERGQHAGGSIPLPGAWTRKSASTDFVVVLTGFVQPSSSERLLLFARQVAVRLRKQGVELGEPRVLEALQAVSATDQLLAAARLMCNSRVVVFDVTGFSGAVMLLLGVRSAVRRGVTILSLGGDYVLGGQADIPFNLQDANIVSHSRAQESAQDKAMRPIDLLSERIRRSLGAVDSPYHFDLPVYEAVRRLPAIRRGVQPSVEGVLVLCSFNPDYTRENWSKCLKPALDNQWSILQARPNAGERVEGLLGVARSIELNSPQLVSRAIYEEMRRAQSCVVDLTRWEASVLFELGVRLTVSPHPTVCLLESADVGRAGDASIDALVTLLRPFRYDITKEYLDESQPFSKVYGPDAMLPEAEVTQGALYRIIEKAVDVKHEPAARPVWRELLDASQLFARQTIGGSTKPVGLFPANEVLTRQEEQADFDRLLTAALFILNCHDEEAILDKSGPLRGALAEALDGLFSRHNDRIGKLEAGLMARLNDFMDKLE